MFLLGHALIFNLLNRESVAKIVPEPFKEKGFQRKNESSFRLYKNNSTKNLLDSEKIF